MRLFFKNILLAIGLFLVLMPSASSAAIVPCGPGTATATCTFCHLLELGQEIIDFLIMLSFPIAAGIIVFGGIAIMTSAGSPDKINYGKNAIKKALIGLVIILASWMLVDVTIRILANTRNPGGLSAPWYEIGRNINCS